MLEKQEAIKSLGVFDGKIDRVQFQKFMAVISIQIERKDDWKGILQWARDHGKTVIDFDSLEPQHEELGKQLWPLFTFKLDGEPWRARRLNKDGHGLELWRRMYDDFDPMELTEATVLKVQLNNLTSIKGP